MPWEERTVQDQRYYFVLEAQHTDNFSALCRIYGISRKTGYKWLQRSQEDAGYHNQSKRPHHSPNATPIEMELLILAKRVAHPAWGSAKIRQVLLDEGVQGLPSPRTCAAILQRNGLVSKEQSQRAKAFQRFERAHCNELWQVDFKGWFLMENGRRFYPFTLVDDHSRYCLGIVPQGDLQGVLGHMQTFFQRYGVPDAILSDNGMPFRSTQGGYSHFERTLMDQNVLPIHGRAYHPQTQGKIERFHGTLKRELLAYTRIKDLTHAREAMEAWRQEYNEVRPHEAIGMKRPADLYRPSAQPYADEVAPWVPEDLPTFRVNSTGQIRIGGTSYYFSEVFAKTVLSYFHNPVTDLIHVFYRGFELGRYNRITGQRQLRGICRR